MSHVIGDVAKGKLADLVLWKPANLCVIARVTTH